MKTTIKKLLIQNFTKGLLVTFFTFGFGLLKSQMLPKEVRNDFCKNAQYQYFYGTSSFVSLMNLSLKKIGISDPYKMNQAVKNICNNITLQDSFFESVHQVSGGLDKQQYLSIGMNVENAQLLSDYYNRRNNNSTPKTSNSSATPTRDFMRESVTDTVVFDQKDFLTSVFKNSTMINDTLISRKEYDAYGSPIDFKTYVAKQYYYIDTKKEEEIINIVLISNAQNGHMRMDIIPVVIVKDSYHTRRNNIIYINPEERKNFGFKTVRKKNYTYFVTTWLDEENKPRETYYNPVTFEVAFNTITEVTEIKKEDGKIIVRPISNEQKQKKFLSSNTIDTKKLFANSNFIERMIKLVGEDNFNFIKSICIKDIFTTNDSIYLTVDGYREAGFKKKNDDNYTIAIAPDEQTLFVGIKKNGKIQMFGEEEVFPGEIYSWEMFNDKSE